MILLKQKLRRVKYTNSCFLKYLRVYIINKNCCKFLGLYSFNLFHIQYNQQFLNSKASKTLNPRFKWHFLWTHLLNSKDYCTKSSGIMAFQHYDCVISLLVIGTGIIKKIYREKWEPIWFQSCSFLIKSAIVKFEIKVWYTF